MSVQALRIPILVPLGFLYGGCTAEENDCFVPGESCVATRCSQVAFCQTDAGAPTCTLRRPNGSACMRDAECVGACDGGVCDGPPTACHR